MRGTGRPDPATQAYRWRKHPSYAKGTFRATRVPANADIVAAFLYWQSLEAFGGTRSATGTFLGHNITGKQITRQTNYRPRNPGLLEFRRRAGNSKARRRFATIVPTLCASCP